MRQQKKKADRFNQRVGDSEVFYAFEEHQDRQDKTRIEAHELFTMFTAGIIKKQTTFVR